MNKRDIQYIGTMAVILSVKAMAGQAPKQEKTAC
jgi:hypothetical protein